MPDKKTQDDAIKALEGAETTELEDEALEDVSGGNLQCNNTQCCQPTDNLA